MSEENEYKLADWLANTVQFPVSAGLVRAIFAKRNVAFDMLYSDANVQLVDLLYADLLVKIARTTPDRLGATTDSDNGWEHSDGGYSISKETKKELIAEANKIYKKYGEPTADVEQTWNINQGGIHRRRLPM